jgi:hypothetical protein
MSMSVNGGDAGGPARAVLHPQESGVALEPDVRARAPGPSAGAGAAAGDAGVLAAPAARAEPSWKSVPVRMGFLPDPSRVAAALRGWAGTDGVQAAAAPRASAARKASTAKRSPTPSSPSPGATASELAFLKDKRLCVEDKLFLFMALMEKKSNAELEQAMTDYAAKREKATAAEKAKAEDKAKESDGGGGGGLLGGIVGAVQGVVKQVGGPLLASAATAVGAPFLVPAALSVGGSLGADLVGAVADLAGIDHGGARTAKPRSTSTASSSGASRAASASPSSDIGEFDEKYEMAKIERLVQKQDAMFACLSNVMKAMHDTQMVAVNNVR